MLRGLVLVAILVSPTASYSLSGIATGRAQPRAPAPLMGGSVAFTKYQGLGNDFMLVDSRDSADGEMPINPEQAARMCDRKFGIGGDGIMFVLPPEIPGADLRMRMYNADGTEPEMCGNGIRCFARFAAKIGAVPSTGSSSISTLAGMIKPNLRTDGQVRVDMGEPFLRAEDVPATGAADQQGRIILAPLTVAGRQYEVTCVGMGNPHGIVFVDNLARFEESGEFAEVRPRRRRAPSATARAASPRARLPASRQRPTCWPPSPLAARRWARSSSRTSCSPRRPTSSS